VRAVLARQAIVVTLSAPAAALVDEIRFRFDPVMAARIDAHLTLVHDVTDRERAPELLRRATDREPFRVRLTHTDRWGPSRYGAYLHVDDPDGAVRDLYETVAPLEAPGWARVAYRPHVTLVHGRTVTEEQAEAAWRALDGFVADWEVGVESVDVIELIEPRWRLVERHTLRAPTGASTAGCAPAGPPS
jgi:2'-5' RNA ligase